MSHNTHTSAGHHAKQSVVPIARAGASPPPSLNDVARARTRRCDSAPPAAHNSLLRRPLLPPRGISLTEVLIAMGILTVGLLGVASIFPVASFYMQQGDVADRGSQIAQSAFNNAVASGQLDPANWWMMSPTDGELYPMTVDGATLEQNFARPVLAAVEECKARWAGAFCARMGGVYLIDPLGVAALTVYDPNAPVEQAVARQFPANARLVDLTKTFAEAHWQPWFAVSQDPVWPVRRVTLRQPRSNNLNSTNYFVKTQPLDRTSAERAFSSSDDLAIDVPARTDRPSTQQLSKFNLDNNTATPDVPLARQSKGDYSWLITAVPSDLRNIAGSPCEVSVVVFYKRPAGGTVVDIDGMKIASQEERVTKAKIISTGLSGGEVLLEGIDDDNDGVTDDDITESPFANLKKGRWIMLSGPAPNSTADRPQFVARWYQVMAIEDSTDVVAKPAMQRVVSLRGPQWPWQPATSGGGALDLDINHLSNNLSAAIIPGAVAVHSKTIRLEGKSSWSMQ